MQTAQRGSWCIVRAFVLAFALSACTQGASHSDESAQAPAAPAAEPTVSDQSGSPQPTANPSAAEAPAPAAPVAPVAPAAPAAAPAAAEPGAKPARPHQQEPLPAHGASKPAPAAEAAPTPAKPAATPPSAAPSAPAAAVTGPCGEKGQPRCPLQAWMEDHLQHAVENDDLPGLAQGLTHAATLVPDASWNAGEQGWTTIAKAGAAAAGAGDLAAAKQSCKTCHKTWRGKYKDAFRLRAIN